MRAKRATPPPPPAGPPRWALALALFAWALALRLLFTHATPDAAWPYSALFKGDAALWLDYAAALEDGRRFELGLPLRPPGNAYLIAALWDGSTAGVRALRAWWAALGAAIPAVLFLAAERSFGRRAALLAGALCAAGHGSIVLSSSLNNEVPYVLLVVASLLLVEGLRARPRAGALAAFSALNAAAALFRAEHVLLYALLLGWLGWSWRRSPRTGALGPAAASLAVFLLALLPWHLAARRAIDRFNTEDPPTTPPEEAALRSFEAALGGLAWEPAAQQERARLPAFLRRQASLFVAATVAHRGGGTVRAEDFGVLPEAFGAGPEPLRARPLVALYGPLNFALAQHPRAGAGFSRAALEDPPPLAGGAARYPPALVAGLPPPDLAFI
ncbi:MAG TPA: glycosyltransferase family 39 protein, partial [Vicinamibacteria bacterium]